MDVDAWATRHRIEHLALPADLFDLVVASEPPPQWRVPAITAAGIEHTLTADRRWLFTLSED